MTFWEEIKRPFNLLMIAIALIPGFYFYYFPRIEKEIAYTASKPSLIFDNSVKSPNLLLMDSTGHQIAANTYLTTFTFWNSGSQPIEPSEIRHPITIAFPKAERILDQKITTVADQVTSGFTLTATTNDMAEQSVQLNWNHFDPRKGVSFQVIFCQTNEPKPTISADIVGLKGIYLQQKTNTKGFDIFLKIFFCILLFLISILFWLKRKANEKFDWRNWRSWPDYVSPLMVLVLFGYLIIRDMLVLSPPFWKFSRRECGSGVNS